MSIVRNRVTFPFIEEAFANAQQSSGNLVERDDYSMGSISPASGSSNEGLSGGSNESSSKFNDLGSNENKIPWSAGESIYANKSNYIAPEKNKTSDILKNNVGSLIAAGQGFSGFKNKGKSGKGAAIAGAAGVVGEIASGIFENQGSDEEVANRKKYGQGTLGADIASNFGPWGAAIGGASKTLTGALKSGDTYSNYGQESSTIASDFGGIVDPISSGMEAVDLYQEGELGIGETVASFLGYSGFTNKAKEKKTKERRAEAEKRQKEMEAQRERLANIKDSKKDFNELMQYSSMYGGSYIAKKGGFIKFDKDSSIVLRKLGYIKKDNKEEIRIFKKGGNFIYKKKNCGCKKPFLKAKSIIMDGPLHSEFNNIGDKGLPIVMHNGGKIYEIEAEELLLNEEGTDVLLELEKANTTDNELGEAFAKILLDNTESKSDSFKCINNNTCTV